MTKFNDYLNDQLKDPAFQKEWDALEPEFSIMLMTVTPETSPGKSEQ